MDEESSAFSRAFLVLVVRTAEAPQPEVARCTAANPGKLPNCVVNKSSEGFLSEFREPNFRRRFKFTAQTRQGFTNENEFLARDPCRRGYCVRGFSGRCG